MTEGAARALAELIHHIRPSWDRAGILSVLKRDQRSDFVVISVAIECAFDHAIRTPGMIRNRDPQRSIGSQYLDTKQPADRKPCDRCKRVHDPEQLACQRSEPEIAISGAARAREALAAAPREWSSNNGDTP